jgi:Ca2+-transporting ATPase
MALSIPARPWAESGQQILEALKMSADIGLTEEEAKHRRRQFGPNRLWEAQRRSAWEILTKQFKSLIVLLLVGRLARSLPFL